MAGINELEAVARRIRGRLVEMSHATGAPHLASALSCVDMLVSLYWNVMRIDPRKPNDPGRDRCILSKGHAVTALYAALAFRGYFPEEMLDTFATPGSMLAEHPIPWSLPGLDAAGGSLGHGLSMGVGMAIAARALNMKSRVYVIMGDGECNEGSVWEAAMFAPARKLDNVAAIVDFNRWQGTGRSEEVLSLPPLAEKWSAFGWSTYEIDGHDIEKLIATLGNVPDGTGKPVAVVAKTVKGKGISFMEDDNNWHYRIPTEDEVRAALKELGLI